MPQTGPISALAEASVPAKPRSSRPLLGPLIDRVAGGRAADGLIGQTACPGRVRPTGRTIGFRRPIAQSLTSSCPKAQIAVCRAFSTQSVPSTARRICLDRRSYPHVFAVFRPFLGKIAIWLKLSAGPATSAMGCGKPRHEIIGVLGRSVVRSCGPRGQAPPSRATSGARRT